MKKLITLTLLTLTASASAQTFAPFGIPLTATAADLKAMGGTLSSNGTYWTVTTPPQANSEFDSYLIISSPSGRICTVIGSGRTINSSSDGSELKVQFNRLKGILNDKYGTSEDFDYLKSGSIWTNTTDWMRAVQNKDRILNSWWNTETKARLPQGIGEIFLSSNATDTSHGWVSVHYRVPDFDACAKESTAPSRTGL